MHVEATDVEDDQITYALEPYGDYQLFWLDTSNGRMEFLFPPDRETQDFFHLMVSATSQQLTAYQNITITLTDGKIGYIFLNDFSWLVDEGPSFYSDMYVSYTPANITGTR